MIKPRALFDNYDPTPGQSRPSAGPHQGFQSRGTGPADTGPAVAGLYVHVPFCFHKCHYCDFYSIVERPGNGDRQAQLTDALLAELHHQAGQLHLQPETIFVGGGTPTLLRPELWQRLLEAMGERGILEQVTEFSVEANPETVTPKLMEVLVAGGVNRVSMGAQSFQPRLLKALERWHDPASVGRAVQTIRAAGIDNLNLDLIFAIPGQTMSELDADLDELLALAPTHLSCYSLIFEPHTPLTQKMKLGMIQPMDEDTELAMYQRVIERLDAAGYEHYEISNWARRNGGWPMADGDRHEHQTPATTGTAPIPTNPSAISSYRCRHNLIYWQNRNWLGVGPAAASHVDGRRWKNVPHLGKYLAGAPTPSIVDEEQLDASQRLGEQLMLGLRLLEGVSLDWLDRALADDEARRTTIQQFIDQGLLERSKTHLRLTRSGLFVADGLVSQLL